jgi:hypothetical protein
MDAHSWQTPQGTRQIHAHGIELHRSRAFCETRSASSSGASTSTAMRSTFDPRSPIQSAFSSRTMCRFEPDQD